MRLFLPRKLSTCNHSLDSFDGDHCTSKSLTAVLMSRMNQFDNTGKVFNQADITTVNGQVELTINSKDEIGDLTESEFDAQATEKLKALRGKKFFNKSINAEIEVRRSTTKKYQRYFFDKNKKLVIPYIPDLLQKAVFTAEPSYTQATEPNIKTYWKADLPIKIDGELLNAHLTIKEDNLGNYVWDLQVKEKSQLTRTGNKPGVEGISITSITPEKPEVKKEYNPRTNIPKVRGGWTKDKIIKYLKSNGSEYGVEAATRAIAEFGSVEDFKEHMFYHGTKSGTAFAMKPSILMSDTELEYNAGGGYGERYWAISLTKSKRVAGTFATVSGSGRIFPILLTKNAKVIEMPETTDSADLDEHIVSLYEQGIDAVWIGDKNAGEQELAVINPKAIINLGTPDFYKAYKLGSAENPIRIRSDEEIQSVYDYAKSITAEYPEGSLPVEIRQTVFWQRTQSNGYYDAELKVIVLGRNMNTMTLPCNFFAGRMGRRVSIVSCPQKN